MKTRIDAAFSILRRLVAKPADLLDVDPYLLNVENGTIELRTGGLRPHDPADLITKLIPIKYKPDAMAPLFEKTLAEITGEAGFVQKPMAAFLQRWFGYCKTLSSLKPVDDYPLYTMSYYGEYGSPRISRLTPEKTESVPAWACSLFTVLLDDDHLLYGRETSTGSSARRCWCSPTLRTATPPFRWWTWPILIWAARQFLT